MYQFPIGKLNPRFLEEMFNIQSINDQRVVVGPAIGEDAAVIDMGDRYLVLKSDPITFATQEIGWYAVNVNANDIATMGAQPKWFLATVLLPEKKTDENLVKGIFEEIIKACESFEITLCGGHTEITAGLDRPIISGHMAGEVEKDKLVVNSNAMVGDEIILTKGIAIEGTSLIAREKGKELVQIYSEDFVENAKRFLYDPGISVVKEALIANNICKIHAMHDPTEGGLATGLMEIAKISDSGLLVDLDQINCYKETKILCSRYNINPLGLLASGSLLIVLEPSDAKKVMDRLKDNNIKSAVIGKLIEKNEGFKILKGGSIYNLPTFSADEITKIY